MPRSFALLAALLFGTSAFAAETDIAVYGVTPGGIAAAVSAARLGRTVTLVEPQNHVGGMTASGLGKSDVANRAMIGGLFVPVAASTTHVAYSSIRMEPTWMCLGQTAGVAAHLAFEEQVPPRRVPFDTLRSLLGEQGQVLRHSADSARP